MEAGIVIHELAHGLSTRLTGGPKNSGCLGWGEAGGMGEGWVYPGRDQGSRSRHSPVPQQPYDPTDDDPIDHAVSVKSTPSELHYIVAPSIQVRPEFSSITRNGETYQPLIRVANCLWW
ncbi:hypothetical protein BDR05DRAFT_1063872 [Suillus weaverae]|nr:hypothetical protein BDR05DRAFT_1063872 [Suillus weaverae]